MSDSDLFSKIASSDYFFYQGEDKIPVVDECKADLMRVLVQPKKSCFFFRSEGAGIKDYENYPIGILLQINLQFGVADAIAFRNTYVTNGQDNYPDRRVATSQQSIDYAADDKGNIDLSIFYYLYVDIIKSSILKLNTGAIR